MTNISSILSGNMNYNWNFGDLTQSTLQNPNKTYPTFGTFKISLIANSNFQCIDSISKWIVVNENANLFWSIFFDFNIEEDKKVMVYDNCDMIKGEALGYVIRSEGGYVGEEVWVGDDDPDGLDADGDGWGCEIWP